MLDTAKKPEKACSGLLNSIIRLFDHSIISPTSPRPGFSLVELLVVIGIIAVLAGVLFASFGGATDSARAAQCLTNMRSLALAANAYAVDNGYYPNAGSVELMSLTVVSGKAEYCSKPGWISWLCEGSYENADGSETSTSSKRGSNKVFPFTGEDCDPREISFALTNGTVWAACGRNKSLYTCPQHLRYRKEKRLSTPYFSYVMNAAFGWDKTEKPVPASWSVSERKYNYYIRYGTLTKADKTLMFAELPTVAVADGDQQEEEKKDEDDILKKDCVLQYLKMSKETGKYASEGDEAESIGFVHKAGKGKRCAHVVFADGHTEKLIWKSGGLDTKTLTACLCRGVDVTFKPNGGWAVADGADD